MALVSYSDSEGSDDDKTPIKPQPATVAAPPSKPAFQKIEPRKIKVDLPALKPEPESQDAAEPPLKRARISGTFGGFNSLLPAPKRAAPAATGLGRGVNLRTSSEAAFSRAPPPVTAEDEAGDGGDVIESSASHLMDQELKVEAEVKIVGKATRFKPLSVGKSDKKAAKKTKLASSAKAVTPMSPATRQANGDLDAPMEPEPAPAKKERRSLFSVAPTETKVDIQHARTDSYEPLTVPEPIPLEPDIGEMQQQTSTVQPNSLQAVAADLNPTPAQRRQLFGRNASTVNVAHFDMDNEYKANEQLRQSGETAEHRAVKSIAPGKHSLQQLVNNARNNQSSIEDKWAEGRRNRGEGGSKYGWSR